MSRTRVLILISILAVLAVAGVWYASERYKHEGPSVVTTPGASSEDERAEPDANEGDVSIPAVSTVLGDLAVPWDVAFLPTREMLVTERGGTLVIVAGNGSRTSVPIPETEHTGEGGLLGIAVHPDFANNRFLYLYHTTAVEGGLTNRVVRYVLREGELTEPKTIISNIPGAPYHDGGRIAFGPPTSCESGQADCFLYITTGDAGRTSNAPDTDSLAGKILRLHDDGRIPGDNPFDNAVWSYGHRNPQGLAWDDAGRLWSTEHGRSGGLSGLDELNLIQRGVNYGWPDSEGDTVLPGTKAPAVHSGPSVTWAPASAAYWDGSIFFGGLRGQTLYEAVLDGTDVIELREHFKGEFGRIRTVTLGPDGMFYITTSNRDGRGTPSENDDRVIRIDSSVFR